MSWLKNMKRKRMERHQAYVKYAQPIAERELKQEEEYYRAKEKEARIKGRIKELKYSRAKQTGNKIRNFAENLKKNINRGKKGKAKGMDFSPSHNIWGESRDLDIGLNKKKR